MKNFTIIILECMKEHIMEIIVQIIIILIITTMVDIEVVVDNNNTQENRATVFGCLSNNSVDKKV